MDQHHIPEENRSEIDQMTAAKAFIMGRNMFGAAGQVTHLTYRVHS